MVESKQQIQSAYDMGGGSRGNRHVRENPYTADIQPKQREAWENGFSDMDAELNSAKGVRL